MTDKLLSTVTVPNIIGKSECIYCFESPFNKTESQSINSVEHSLNTCISCFQAVCRRHLGLHMNVTNHLCDSPHLSYLEIAKVIKPDSEEEQTLKETGSNKKLKLQVIDKSEDETYNTLWALKAYNSINDESANILSTDKDTQVSEESKNIIDKIINAKAQELVDQTTSWELEVKSCSHSRALSDQINTQSNNDSNLNQCSSCDLTENLWLCLHCGNVGCGREQVGIDGNSHALKHFETNEDHPIAIKLGSLSSSSNDVYCYSCNDEVTFDNKEDLSKILLNYGVDLQNKQANEKTLVELQVEQNMNWDFKMMDSQGNDLVKLNSNKDLGCGLINLGNSCYMNSVIKVLLNGGIPGWSLDSIGSSFPMDVVYPSNNLLCQLIKLNIAMKIEPERYPDGIKPTSFKKCITRGNAEFSSGKQQDSMEFFTFLTNQLDKKIFKNINKENNPNNLFKFSLEERMQCNNCKAVKYITQTEEHLQLPLKENQKAQTLTENIENYFNGEEVDFTCPHCTTSTSVLKTPAFKSYPSTLIINPIRIKLENLGLIKIDNELNMPGLGNNDYLDLSPYKSKGFNPDSEVLMKDEEESNKFVPNQTSVAQLNEMGFTLNAVTRALFATGNQDTESAMNWLFQHMEDFDLNEPFTPPVKSKSNDCDPEALNNMIAMGLYPKLCKKALLLNNHDVNKSVEWVFGNMDDDGELDFNEETTVPDEIIGFDQPASYQLTAVVCHKGNSVHSGHYVAFIKKNIDNKSNWVLFNDEKIVLAQDTDELKKNGYIYVYTRCS
ncbi:hypothetical protein TPHA_0M01090 [Tetrapisispora phaffii CBS 4417]|uniref:Ubiquitin carboxyl-terminal hydrolase n=1 Tax=Tetrapisispora phaffii (strain ATCC 24235 / CBS 4417 / NBRC 1672 / NRRL Y-8282 / UCD 70-5) TaxID=1071381 RepID=G8C0G9_TETPH|nr:hypothetical protein TPHA_0M01090 [Tetrapisispora phaffii CBS 4417]CCE65684.1 hypothetical protein TPHA_0M01090 [Tetrapisispora phaffii CBS 4417]